MKCSCLVKPLLGQLTQFAPAIAEMEPCQSWCYMLHVRQLLLFESECLFNLVRGFYWPYVFYYHIVGSVDSVSVLLLDETDKCILTKIVNYIVSGVKLGAFSS